MLIDSYCSAIHSLDTTSAFSTPTYTLSSPLTNPIPRYFLSWQSDDHDISSTTSVNASITSSPGSICAFIMHLQIHAEIFAVLNVHSLSRDFSFKFSI